MRREGKCRWVRLLCVQLCVHACIWIMPASGRRPYSIKQIGGYLPAVSAYLPTYLPTPTARGYCGARQEGGQGVVPAVSAYLPTYLRPLHEGIVGQGKKGGRAWPPPSRLPPLTPPLPFPHLSSCSAASSRSTESMEAELKLTKEPGTSSAAAAAGAGSTPAGAAAEKPASS